jgi:hypothetical protein
MHIMLPGVLMFYVLCFMARKLINLVETKIKRRNTTLS